MEKFEFETSVTKKQFFRANIASVKKTLVLFWIVVGALVVVSALALGADFLWNPDKTGVWKITGTVVNLTLMLAMAAAIFTVIILIYCAAVIPFAKHRDPNFYGKKTVRLEKDALVLLSGEQKIVCTWGSVRVLFANKDFVTLRDGNKVQLVIPKADISDTRLEIVRACIQTALYKRARNIEGEETEREKIRKLVAVDAKERSGELTSADVLLDRAIEDDVYNDRLGVLGKPKTTREDDDTSAPRDADAQDDADAQATVTVDDDDEKSDGSQEDSAAAAKSGEYIGGFQRK